MALTDSQGRNLLTLPLPAPAQGATAVQGIVLVNPDGTPVTLQVEIQFEGVTEGPAGPPGPQGPPGSGGGGSSSASEVTYTTTTDGSIATVQDALDKIFFVAMTCSMGGGGSYENGQSLATVPLTWSFSKTLATITLSGPGTTHPDPSATSETVTGPFTTNTSWSVTGVTAGGESKSAGTSISFYNRMYWGHSPNASLTDAQILALNSQLSGGRGQTQTFSPGGDYIYFAWPTSFGEPTFVIGGLTNTAWTEVQRTFVNAYGYSTSYNIYRSNTVQNGTGIVIVVS